MTFAVLIHETKGHIEQIELDIAPHKNEIFKHYRWNPNIYRSMA